LDVKGEVQSKLRNGTKTFLEPKFSQFIVRFKKLGFSASLMLILINSGKFQRRTCFFRIKIFNSPFVSFIVPSVF